MPCASAGRAGRFPARRNPRGRNAVLIALGEYALLKASRNHQKQKTTESMTNTVRRPVVRKPQPIHLPAERGSGPSSAASNVWVGTSGWMYDGWRGSLYPDGLPKRAWLSYYASRFSTVEINSAFYRTPSLEAVRSWRNDTPHDFRFAWKASKFITHWKRLGDSSENSIALMQTRLKVLSPKISVVLFQLPPQFVKNTGRLNSFLRLLPRRRYAFEFRHPSWYDDA